MMNQWSQSRVCWAWMTVSSRFVILFFPSFLCPSLPSFHFELSTVEVLPQVQNRLYNGLPIHLESIVEGQTDPSPTFNNYYMADFFLIYSPICSCVRFGTLTNNCEDGIKWPKDLLGKILEGKGEESQRRLGELPDCSASSGTVEKRKEVG